MEQTPSEIPILPLHILSSILLRLPIKPLSRFKCVSKSWYSLINSPHFIKLHLNTNLPCSPSLALLPRPPKSTTKPPPTHLLIMDLTSLDQPPFHLTLSFSHYLPPLRPHSDIISSCNGLLCISNYPSWLSIFNPITPTHYKVVPFLEPKPKSGHSDSHWVDFGFGFDHSSDDYKVVRLDQFNGPHYAPKKEVSVFSLKTQSWKRVSKSFPHFLCHPQGHGKYAANCLFWLTTTSPPRIYDTKGFLRVMGYGDVSPYDYAILAFDLSTDKFRVVDLPEYGFDVITQEKVNLPRLSLWVLDGKDLCLMVVHGDLSSRLLDVWLLKDVSLDNNCCWKKILYAFPWQEVRKCGFPLRPLAICQRPSGGEEMLMEQDSHELFWIDLRNGNTRDVKTSPMPMTMTMVSGHFYCFSSVAFMPSLVSLSDCDGGSVDENKDGNEACGKNDKKMNPKNKKKLRGSKLK